MIPLVKLVALPRIHIQLPVILCGATFEKSIVNKSTQSFSALGAGTSEP
jgi:hypothetical protein